MRRLRLGPAALVTAAFVGPGTVATCTLAGARAGYGLLWALVFSVFATTVLQDTAARLGAGARMGLGTALLEGRGPAVRTGTVVLVLGALAVGNAAYEAGNMIGALAGLEILLGESLPRTPALMTLGAGAALALSRGGLLFLQRALTAVVVVMSIAFGFVYLGTGPSPGAAASGLIPSFPLTEPALAVALVGTTVVPYNLFLHASASRADARGPDDARRETVVSIALGGLVSLFILGTAAELGGADIRTPADLARGLEAALGPSGRTLMGLGLLAAGLTSALTAPLATGLVVQELFPAAGRGSFLAASLGIVACGVAIGATGFDPVALIVAAQVANGILLPVVIAFLLATMNRRDLLGSHVNGTFANLAGGLVFLVGLGLGLRLVARGLGLS
ncbi:MAG: Nramp family divalent metal transporter [Myxococcota bacterium]